MQTTRLMSEYIDSVAIPQIKELLTNYGDVAILWWDTPIDMEDEFAEKLQSTLSLQPDIITNDRLKRPNFPGDYKTPENKIPKFNELDGNDWETCMTMNKSWGYRKSDNNWKSSEVLIRNLIDIASKGGNYLLNVGPKADGEFPIESVERLKEIGKWMKINGEAIYGTKGSPLNTISWGRYTTKIENDNSILYLFVFDWPSDNVLILNNINKKVESAYLIEEGNRKLEIKQSVNDLKIYVPDMLDRNYARVIKINIEGKL